MNGYTVLGIATVYRTILPYYTTIYGILPAANLDSPSCS